METRLRIKDTGLGGEKHLIVKDAADDVLEIRTKRLDGTHDHAIYIEHGIDLISLIYVLQAHYDSGVAHHA